MKAEERTAQTAASQRRIGKLKKKLAEAEKLPAVVLDAGTSLERTVPHSEVGLLQRQIAESEAAIIKLEAQAN